MSTAATSPVDGPRRTESTIGLDRVRSIGFVAEPEVRRIFVEWFTSPYWHAPRRITELLEESVCVSFSILPSDGRLAETDLSRVVRSVAHREIEGVADSLVDQYVFDDSGDVGAVQLALAIHHDRDAVVLIESTSGTFVSASLAAAMAWVVSESLRVGFPGEVAHGHRSILRRFVEDGSDPSEDGTAALPFTALLPLPAGIAARSAAQRSSLAVPLAAYPLFAMLLPECSAAMFPTDGGLRTLLDDASIGERRGRLEPIGRWGMLRLELGFALSRPLSRPLRALLGIFARALGWSVDRVTRSRIGRASVERGVNLEWLWSLLRRGSSVGDNQWMNRSGRMMLERSEQVEVRS